MSPRKPRSNEMFGPGGLITDPRPLMDYWEASRYEALDSKPIRLDQPLQSGLSRYPGNWVDALCKSLGLSNKGKKRSKIKSVAEKLWDENVLRQIVTNLPTEAKQALHVVLQEGGWIKYAALSRKFGDEGPDSYFWNEKPPVSPIGQLRLHGLLFIGRHDLGGRRYKVAVVPQELRGPLTAILSGHREEKPPGKDKKAKKFSPGQVVAPFYVVCPEVKAPEVRTVTTTGWPGLPDDKYALIDCYCLDPKCDCRVVYIQVVGSSAPGKVLASINFGLEPIRFYREWFEKIGIAVNNSVISNEISNFKGPALCFWMEQTDLAPALLELIAPKLQDPAYLQVLKRHYHQFKAALRSFPSHNHPLFP